MPTKRRQETVDVAGVGNPPQYFVVGEGFPLWRVFGGFFPWLVFGGFLVGFWWVFRGFSGGF